MGEHETDNYVRLLLFVINIGSCLLRDILMQELMKGHMCLSDILEDKKVEIEQKLNSRVLTRKQYDQLYPDGNKSDIESWDVTLLSFILLLIFEQPFTPEVCTAIENIREHRNFVAHSESATIDDLTYLSKELKVKHDLQILVLHLDPKDQGGYVNRINQCSTKTFSQAGMDNLLKGLCKKEDIQDQFDKLNSTYLKDMEQRIISRLTEEIQKNTNARDIPTICIVLEIDGGDRAKNADATKLLLKLFQAAKHKAANPCCYEDVFQEASSLLDALASSGAKVEDITSKCLVFHLRCSSLKTLLDVIELIKTEENFIVKSLQKICGVIMGENSTFHLSILRSSMMNLLSYLADVQQVKMQLLITDPALFTSERGIIHSEKANIVLNKMSKSLSTVFGYPLSIGASLEQTEMTPTVKDPTEIYDFLDAIVWLDAHGVDYEELESFEEMVDIIQMIRDRHTENGENKVYDAHTLTNRAFEGKWKLLEYLSSLYGEVYSEWFMHSGLDLDEDIIGFDFKGSFKDHMHVLSEDRHIIVAGETSSGKSSLLNLLLGTDVFPSSLVSTTSGISNFHAEGTRKFIVAYKDGERIAVEVDDSREYKEHLKHRVSRVEKIDIYSPNSNIKAKVKFVDTPGIDDCIKAAERIMEYASKTAAFIFVINCSNAGVHWEKFLLYLRQLDSRSTFSQICPSKMIFVCNKWDMVDAQEEENVWKQTVDKLKSVFPDLREENVSKMSVTKAERYLRTGLGMTKEHQRLLETITSVVDSQDQARLLYHSRWLKKFLYGYSDNSQLAFRRHTRIIMPDYVHWFVSHGKQLVQEINLQSKALTSELRSHLQSDTVTKRLLHWHDDDVPEILEEDMEVTKFNMSTKVLDKIAEEVAAWERSTDHVLGANKCIINCIKTNISTLEQKIELEFGQAGLFKGEQRDLMSESTFNTSASGRSFQTLPQFLEKEVLKQLSAENATAPLNINNKVAYIQQMTIAVLHQLCKDDRLCINMVQGYPTIFKTLTDELLLEYPTNYGRSFHHSITKTQTFVAGMIMRCEDLTIKTEKVEHICEFEPAYTSTHSVVEWTTDKFKKMALMHSVFISDILGKTEGLRALRHTNVLKMYGCSMDPGRFSRRAFVLLEYCQESLQTLVYNDTRLQCSRCISDEEWRYAFCFFMEMAIGVCNGVEFLHGNGHVSEILELSTVLVKAGVPKVQIQISSRFRQAFDINCLGVLLVDLWNGDGRYSTLSRHVMEDSSQQKEYIVDSTHKPSRHFDQDSHMQPSNIYMDSYTQPASILKNEHTLHQSKLEDILNRMDDCTTMPSKLKSLVRRCLHNVPRHRPYASHVKSDLLLIYKMEDSKVQQGSKEML